MNNMTELLQQPETIGKRLEKTRTLTSKDLQYLHELVVPLTTCPDRDFVVKISERTNKEDKRTNREKQRAFLMDELGIDTTNLRLPPTSENPEGVKLNERLATEVIFSWIAAAHTLESYPEREIEILKAINETIRIRDFKRELVESKAIKDFAQHGLSFFRSDSSLPQGALSTMWGTLETALKAKQQSPET